LKIAAVADLHGELPPIPACDVLLIAGDICPDISFARGQWDPDLMRDAQMEWLATDWAAWEATIPHVPYIFMTPGNHDWIEAMPETCRARLLIDAGAELPDDDPFLGPIMRKFWFTPWVSPIGSWNYTADRGFRKAAFSEIPSDLDVLVAHSPAHFLGDRTWSGEPVGCPELRQAVYEKKPAHMIFGHIHEGQRYGLTYTLGQTLLHHVSYFPRKSVELWTI
jgi:Icc-related predicted phosphoesterase